LERGQIVVHRYPRLCSVIGDKVHNANKANFQESQITTKPSENKGGRVMCGAGLKDITSNKINNLTISNIYKI
jgi:hypothetical protein